MYRHPLDICPLLSRARIAADVDDIVEFMEELKGVRVQACSGWVHQQGLEVTLYEIQPL